MPYLVQADLEEAAGQATVARMFDDDGDGVADSGLIAPVIKTASELFDSYAMEGWPDPDMRALLAADAIIKRHMAWVAVHFRAQTKPEWRGQDGKAPYRVEYDDACAYFDRLAKGKARSNKELVAGQNLMTRGQINRPDKPFVFASSRDDPKGPGGF